MYSIENKQATRFEYVNIYVADPWYAPVDGKIRNLSVTGGAAIAKNNGKINLNNTGITKLKQDTGSTVFKFLPQ